MLPKLYEDLAEWWPLLSAPDEYEEEAAVYARFLGEVGTGEARTVLELGSGGGNNAFYLKRSFQMTLVDLSGGMQEHSRRLNPECEHHLGDMRSIRLGRQFDRVFIQDAICYMASQEDLRQVMETAYVHCRPGRGRGSGSGLCSRDVCGGDGARRAGREQEEFAVSGVGLGSGPDGQ